MRFSPLGLSVAQYSTVWFSANSRNKRLPLTTPTISYPSPLPLTSRLPSGWIRCKSPHSSESHTPFTLISGGAFWESSHALPSTSTFAAGSEVGTEMHSNSSVSANVRCFMRVSPFYFTAWAERSTLFKLFWISDQIRDRRPSTCKLTDLPPVVARGQFFYHLTQFLWSICPQAGYDSIEQQNQWNDRNQIRPEQSRPAEWTDPGR